MGVKEVVSRLRRQAQERLFRYASSLGTLVTFVWFRGIVSVTVLAVLLARVDAGETARVLAAVDVGPFLGATVVDFVARAVMIGRWDVLLRLGGSSGSSWSTAKIFFMSSFIGIGMPTGGADLTRAYLVSRYSIGTGAATASVVVDRIVGTAALMAVGVAGLTFGACYPAVAFRPLLMSYCLVILMALLGMFYADGVTRTLMPRLVRRTSVGHWLLHTAAAISEHRTKFGTLGIVMGFSLAVQLLRVTEFFLLSESLGLGVGFGYYLAYIPIGLLVLMLPASILGIGVPQGVIIWLLRPAGLSDAQSLALSSLVVVLVVVGTLPGCFFYLSERRRAR